MDLDADTDVNNDEQVEPEEVKDEEEDKSNKSTRKRAASSSSEERERHRQLVWPKATTANPDFAITFDNNQDRIWLFYAVNGSRQLAQIHQSSPGTWEPALLLPKRNDSAPSSSPPEVNGGSGDEEGSGAGLSTGGKTGVGVGLGLGLPLVGAAIAAYMFTHSRRSRRAREAEFAAVQDAHAAATSPALGRGGVPAADVRSWAGSPAPGYTSGGFWGSEGGGGYWANGQWVVPPEQYGKMDDPRYSMQLYGSTGSPPPPSLPSQQQQQQPMLHEMAHQEPMHEVAGDGQVPEMPAATPVSPPPPPLVSVSPPPPAQETATATAVSSGDNGARQ